MAEYRDAPLHPIAPRLSKDPTPHVDSSTYKKDHDASLKNPDEFWGKVSQRARARVNAKTID